MPSGYQIIDANGMVLAHVYGRPNGAIAGADIRLTNDEKRRVAKLLASLRAGRDEAGPEQAPQRRKPLPLRFKPATIGDLIREGKLLEVHCGACRPERHLDVDAGSLGLPQAHARWRSTSSALDAVPGTATPIARSGRGLILNAMMTMKGCLTAE